ncbi:hypothetical protein [Chryseobacterium candidae]|uniref:ATP-binding protein n=1 Tax=Chryseobacterium candidae TaxID=1978493 RepID=A0ABY2R294_9FLAO|nr:hypothetical protein [Chryseobacterium candidae]THV56430.1 hypothetical protein EK417_18850 [Chryseobacterium candidae]
MKINNLWEKLSLPEGKKLNTFKMDVAEGKVPELPYYIVGQESLKKIIGEKIEKIDSSRMTSNLIIASYGNGKTNLLKYIQLFFTIHKEYNIKVHNVRADIERTDLIIFLLKIIQDSHLDDLISAIKHNRNNDQQLKNFVNDFQSNFAEIKEYSKFLFNPKHDDEVLKELIYLGTGRLYNKRYFDKYKIEQLKDFNRREILVFFLNLLANENVFLIFGIDEIEKIREKSKIRFNHFLTSYRELVDLFNLINGHYLIIAMTDSTDSNSISEANNALYTRIKNDIITIEPLTNPQDLKELIIYLNDLFGTKKEVEAVVTRIRKSLSQINRTNIQNIAKILFEEELIQPFETTLEDYNLSKIFYDTYSGLERDEAFKNIHRKFFDPFEYYIESLQFDTQKLNRQERVFVDDLLEKVHYFIFNDLLEDLDNEKVKVSKLTNNYPDHEIVIYSPEKLELTNSLLENEDNKIKIIDYEPKVLFTLLEIYRKNFDKEEVVSDVISIYSQNNL